MSSVEAPGLVRWCIPSARSTSSTFASEQPRSAAASASHERAAALSDRGTADGFDASTAPLRAAATKVVQVDESILAHVTAGGRVVLKGMADVGNAVLCTPSQTYALTFVENSNTQLLCARTEEGGVDVLATVQGFIELRVCTPSLWDIRALLRRCPPYRGDTDEERARWHASDTPSSDLHAGTKRGRPQVVDGSPDTGVTLEQLQGQALCSNAELATALVRLQAIDVRRHVRLLDDAYMYNVLRACVLAAEALGAPLHRIPVNGVVAELGEQFPAPVVQHVLLAHSCTGLRSITSAYEWPDIESSDAAATLESLPDTTVSMSFEKLAMRVAWHVLQHETIEVLLRGAAARCATASGAAPTVADREAAVDMIATDAALAPNGIPWLDGAAFLRAWESAMPDGTVQPATAEAAAPDGTCTGALSLDMLAGAYALVDTGDESAPSARGAARAILRIFPRDELSPVPATRFRQLFSLRPRWRLPELRPFLEPCEAPGVKIADLLLAHTRRITHTDGSHTFAPR